MRYPLSMKVAELVLDYVKVLIWPSVVLTFGLLFRKHIIELIRRIRHAELPGGVAIDVGQEITDAKELSAKVQAQPLLPDKSRGQPVIPLTEANARMIHLGLRPSPSGLDLSYYRSLAQQDPNIALAGLTDLSGLRSRVCTVGRPVLWWCSGGLGPGGEA